jgi:hypothetical protein
MAPGGHVEEGRLRGDGRRTAIPAVIAGTVIAVLLLLTGALPLTAGPRPALTPTVLNPGALPGAIPTAIPSALAGESAAPELPSSAPSEPYLADRKEAVPIEVDGNAVGTAAVMSWSLDPGPSAGDVPIAVDVHYSATAPWDLGTGSWEILLDDGSTRDLTVTSTLPLAPLAPGQMLDVKVRGKVPTNAGSPFVGYVDAETGDFVFVVAVE